MCDSFLTRWSRLMRGSGAALSGDLSSDGKVQGLPPSGEQAGSTDLPPVDDLGGDSDYTVFMKEGVPGALRLAALRRAWTTDPAIARHRAPADYDWDFDAPGYGRLRPGDVPAKLAHPLYEQITRAPATSEATAAESEPGSATRDGVQRQIDPACRGAESEPQLLREGARLASPSFRPGEERES